MMVLELLEVHLDMVRRMPVGVATLVILMLGVILHKVVDLVVRSMEVLKDSQIMVVAMVVCNPGFLSERGN
jgi:hypothetical protein